MKELLENWFYEILLIITGLLISSVIFNLSLIRKWNALAKSKSYYMTLESMRRELDALEVGLFESHIPKVIIEKDLDKFPEYGIYRRVGIDKVGGINDSETIDHLISVDGMTVLRNAFTKGSHSISLRKKYDPTIFNQEIDNAPGEIEKMVLSVDPMAEGGISYPLGYSKSKLILYTVWIVTSLGGKNTGMIESDYRVNNKLKSHLLNLSRKLSDMELDVLPYSSYKL